MKSVRFVTAFTLLASLVALHTLTAGAVLADSSSDPSSDLGTIERAVAKGINAHRAATGRPAFRSDATVAKIARGHSEAMAKGKVGFGHDGLKERVALVQKTFEIAGAAENVSKHQNQEDPAQVAVAKWLKSPAHLKNINGNYDLTGVGAAQSADGTIFITQIFVKLRSGPV